MADHTEVDSVSGTATTGHAWDGIKELNTPLPRWWVITFYITIIWAIGYWIVYPAWPTISSNTKGLFGYSSRADVAVELANLEKIRGAKMAALATASLADIEKDPQMLALARAKGKTVFGDNCAACHGTGAAGAKGFPNLNDDDWLWGGSLEQIQQTLLYGVRSGHPKTREGQMLAFGKDGVLKPAEIVTVANYVRELAGLPTRQGYDAKAGAKIFAENCVACHGDNAKGNPEVGAPNLTDKIWLYGSDEATLIETITNGRAGVMPAWEGRLDPTTIKAMAVYVHSLGGGK
ncbi:MULTISPECIES: cytochrome-c oxidase, cbb3-type subunit III [Bradyrhizobium]|jgi:cytochrome c oxidase cbb3-type subunit 3|uniref:Cbb3-type cytochrome c oxidase subunit n=4 Tax=Bradyrhizobium TaxID=374 RepID=A0ABS5G6G1_9BRAD|nr:MULTISPECIES: cytochrome-c oxidase, cbb3-type subunit III [Bradyrhizobium]RTM03324.1 MAG: cytochrome-c oxidase, cbb3-type subunit III [Bradyrhizobiaceae bacterium]ABQ34927.1 cytochrome-c oxidase fixP chain [Bradyrhizobium sp. BTAi1]MBR1136907.1 cytochrome-c oxidase, cbb3-type subunit III [Bradyrhizobium denitrificans]MCL8485010.1 cytochrome-c oxidase, cbb3-type subunit III [Bradyrhizobium denitrificans]MDU1492512.1 cytochrome-c oxidase, cbb3-type subunit III [Bradyrhizobium sp.]